MDFVHRKMRLRKAIAQPGLRGIVRIRAGQPHYFSERLCNLLVNVIAGRSKM
jgi:hypothetical protein